MAIQRLNYFTGQFLRDTDFNVEQGYHLSMRRSHNRRSHTPGIVQGLEVEAGTGQVVVKAGMAIDPDGREIVVAEDMAVPVSQAAAFAYVVIALDESKTDLAAETDPIPGETRWTETPVASVATAVPAGAIVLAQIASVAANGSVTLNGTYRRIHSAPAVGGDLTIGRDLTVMGNLEVRGQTTQIDTQQMRGNVVLGDADADTITVEGTVSTGHSSGRLKISSPLDVTGDIVVSGNVDGRDVSGDGARLDTHTASTSNPHATTAAQVDEQGGTNRLVAQINAGTGVIAEARIHNTIARESRFHTSTGHGHDGTDSKRIAPGSLEGVNESVTAAALNALTGGPDSNAAAYHTHPFVPADGSVSRHKLDAETRMRMLKVPLLQQSVQGNRRSVYLGGGLSGGTAFDGTSVWVVNTNRNLAMKIDPATNAVVSVVTVGSDPCAIAFGNGFIWVANWGSYSVSKIDVATDTVVDTVGVGSGPVALAVSGGFLWVANCNSNTVSRINMSTNAVAAPIVVGTAPMGVVVVGTFVWVANTGSNDVRKIDTSDNTVKAIVSVGSQPVGLAATTETFLWVANSGANTVSKINVSTNTVAAEFDVGFFPATLAVIGKFLWVGEDYQVRKIDTANNSTVATVSAPNYGWGNSMASVPGFLWVSGGTQATKIDVVTHTVSATVLTQEARGMAFDGLHLWVAIYGSSVVLKVDLNAGQVASIVAVGIRPHSVAYNGSHVFVTNFGSNTVSKIDPSTATVVDTIPVGANPTGIAANPKYGTLWVANSGDGTASVFHGNSTSVEAIVAVGTNPQTIASEGSYVWVTNTGSNSVSRVGAWVGSTPTNLDIGEASKTILFDYSSLWVTTGANTLTKIVADSTALLTVDMPSGAVPAKMCFNGTHIVVLCADQQVYKVDVHTNAVLRVSNAYLGFGGDGLLAYDGVSVWAAGDPGWLDSITL
jgi:YVTN family beta-propeller protein